jgi:hypothetical protein
MIVMRSHGRRRVARADAVGLRVVAAPMLGALGGGRTATGGHDRLDPLSDDHPGDDSPSRRAEPQAEPAHVEMITQAPRADGV